MKLDGILFERVNFVMFLWYDNLIIEWYWSFIIGYGYLDNGRFILVKIVFW